MKRFALSVAAVAALVAGPVAAQHFAYTDLFGSFHGLCGGKVDEVNNCNEQDEPRDGHQRIQGRQRSYAGVEIRVTGVEMDICQRLQPKRFLFRYLLR